jgi:hypothetical protein
VLREVKSWRVEERNNDVNAIRSIIHTAFVSQPSTLNFIEFITRPCLPSRFHLSLCQV